MKSNKPLLAFFGFCTYSLTPALYAQTPNDSISSYTLQEVEVKASKVIRKPDMDIYYPSVSAVENSRNGLQLLTNVMVPSLFVDEVMGKITASGSPVQIRINGHIASVEQLRNILPENIKRIEWIDNPGLRYNETDYVLNFIVINPEIGGDIMLTAQPMLNAINLDQWQFGALMFMPFGNYDQGSKMLSKWNSNETHLRLDFKMIGLQVSYNLQWGKQKTGIDKLINSDASVEKSSAKTR